MKVAIVQLITGEQLLCELLLSGADLIRIKNPVMIMVVPSKEDPRTPSVGLAPWGQFSAKREFLLLREHVLLIIDEPVKDFEDQYKGMFGGILTPDRKLILPQ